MMLWIMKDALDDISICPMTESDLEQVLSIENDAFPLPWSRNHFLDELSSPHSFPLAALGQDGLVLGYICPMQLLDEGHILDVAVRKDFCGRGLGRLLVETALRICREKGADFVSLEVRPSNVTAISLYRRLGFVEVGRRKRYYENGEDAILMEYLFNDSEEGGDAV
jgi:ribosomal-protein-alanine N-acetyltransferase